MKIEYQFMGFEAGVPLILNIGTKNAEIIVKEMEPQGVAIVTGTVIRKIHLQMKLINRMNLKLKGLLEEKQKLQRIEHNAHLTGGHHGKNSSNEEKSSVQKTGSKSSQSSDLKTRSRTPTKQS